MSFTGMKNLQIRSEWTGRARRLLLWQLFVLVSFAGPALGDWPQFRGPNSCGIAPGASPPVEFGPGGRVVLNQYHQVPGHENVYVVGDSAALKHAPSAQVAEGQAEQIAEVIEDILKGKALPEEMSDIKMQGILGSLGSKEGFAYLKERTVTGRIARMLKSGVLWMYKLGNN